MTSSGNAHDDDELVAALDDAFDHDLAELPADLSRFALDAFQWATIEGELARLSSDAGGPLEIARGSPDERLLIFESSAATIELLVSSGLVVGSIYPEGTYDVTFSTPGRSRRWSVTTDPFGRFQAEISAPFRVSVHGDGGSLTTEWITA